jgi:hypothetical protein
MTGILNNIGFGFTFNFEIRAMRYCSENSDTNKSKEPESWWREHKKNSEKEPNHNTKKSCFLKFEQGLLWCEPNHNTKKSCFLKFEQGLLWCEPNHNTEESCFLEFEQGSLWCEPKKNSEKEPNHDTKEIAAQWCTILPEDLPSLNTTIPQQREEVIKDLSKQNPKSWLGQYPASRLLGQYPALRLLGQYRTLRLLGQYPALKLLAQDPALNSSLLSSKHINKIQKLLTNALEQNSAAPEWKEIHEQFEALPSKQYRTTKKKQPKQIDITLKEIKKAKKTKKTKRIKKAKKT